MIDTWERDIKDRLLIINDEIASFRFELRKKKIRLSITNGEIIYFFSIKGHKSIKPKNKYSGCHGLTS
jgi:hypothetical protein